MRWGEGVKAPTAAPSRAAHAPVPPTSPSAVQAGLYGSQPGWEGPPPRPQLGLETWADEQVKFIIKDGS